MRARQAAAQISPPIWRILTHSFIFGLAASFADVLFNFYLVSLGYRADVAGLMSTIFRIAGVVLGLPIGILIDRVGARRAVMIGAVTYGAAWALVLVSEPIWLLGATYFMAGAANILTLTAVVPLLTGVTPQANRPAIFGYNAFAALVVGLLGSAIGGALPAVVGGALRVDPQATVAYRGALMSVVALGLLAIIPLLRGIPEERRIDRAAAASPSDGRALGRRELLMLAIPALTLGVGGGLILPFQNLFFRQQFGMSDAAVGVTLGWAAVGMGVGALLGSPASQRLGMQRAAALLRLGTVPAMLLMLVPVLPIAGFGFLMRGLFVAASFPLMDALTMTIVPPRQRGTAVSLTSVSWSLGWAASAAVSGWIQIHLGFGPVIVAAIVAYGASGLAIWWLRIER